MDNIKVEHDVETGVFHIFLTEEPAYKERRVTSNIIVGLNPDGMLTRLTILELGAEIPYRMLKEEFFITDIIIRKIRELLPY
jgi:hypothetical protein